MQALFLFFSKKYFFELYLQFTKKIYWIFDVYPRQSRDRPLLTSLYILIVKGQTIQSNRLPFDFLTFSNFFSLLF